MSTVAAVLVIVAGVAHVAFFVAESLLFDRPAVHRAFGARDAETARIQAPAFLNLGFYNLFLGLGAIVGGVLLLSTGAVTLAIFTALFMVSAALVLVTTSRALWRGALVQGLLPAVAVLLLLAS
jgi:putative membrane protein